MRIPEQQKDVDWAANVLCGLPVADRQPHLKELGKLYSDALVAKAPDLDQTKVFAMTAIYLDAVVNRLAEITATSGSAVGRA
jgi:hypothetical protein